MDDQLLRDALRTSTDVLDTPRPAPASEIRAMGDRRRRRRTVTTSLSLAAAVVVLLLLRPGGIGTSIIDAAGGPPTSAGGTSSTVVLLGWGGVGLSVALALLAVGRAWRWRAVNGSWWAIGAALVAVTSAGSTVAIWEWWRSLLWLAHISIDNVVYWDLPLLVVVTAGVLMAGPRGRTSAPIAIALAATALTGGVVVTGPLGLGSWWGLAGTGGWLVITSFVQVVALGALAVGWVRSDAARHPWGGRRVDTMVSVVVLSIAVSALLGTGVLGERDVYNHGSLTIALALGVAVLLAIPTVSVCLSTSRRQAGRVVAATAVAAAVVNITYLIRSLPEPLGSGFPAGYLAGDARIAAWTFGGVLVLWIASRIAVPPDGVDPDDPDDEIPDEL